LRGAVPEVGCAVTEALREAGALAVIWTRAVELAPVESVTVRTAV
jgi:hypothetical protein